MGKWLKCPAWKVFEFELRVWFGEEGRGLKPLGLVEAYIGLQLCPEPSKKFSVVGGLTVSLVFTFGPKFYLKFGPS